MRPYRPLSVAAALLAATLAVAVPATPAQAHTELSRTTPAAKSTVTKPVTEVTLTFTGLIKKAGTTVAVTGPDKASYSAGDAEVLNKTITQKVDALPAGTITVAWRTVASDGHVLQGTFTFTNKSAPPTPTEPTPTADVTPSAATTPSAPATSATAQAPASDTSDTGTSPVVWVVGGAIVLALLGGLLWMRRRS